MKLLRTTRLAERGAIMTEAMVAMAILLIAVFPLAFSFQHERTLLKAAYYRAVAMEVVDGEMEILAAGEWRSFLVGTQTYAVHAAAVTNLPPGEFRLTINPNRIRLEWLPTEKHSGGAVIREASVK